MNGAAMCRNPAGAATERVETTTVDTIALLGINGLAYDWKMVPWVRETRAKRGHALREFRYDRRRAIDSRVRAELTR
jgi:hypothetical protein